MKYFILLLLVGLNSMGPGQNEKPGAKWQFGFSLKDKPVNIYNQLSLDSRFSSISKLEKVRSDSSKIAYIFFAKSLNSNFSDAYHLDSMTIFLTAGRSNNENGILYSGYLKYLQSGYFSKNESIIDNLYSLAIKDYKNGTTKKQQTKIGWGGLTIKKKALFITYKNEITNYYKTEIWKSFDPSTGVYSLSVQETMSDN